MNDTVHSVLFVQFSLFSTQSRFARESLMKSSNDRYRFYAINESLKMFATYLLQKYLSNFVKMIFFLRWVASWGFLFFFEFKKHLNICAFTLKTAFATESLNKTSACKEVWSFLFRVIRILCKIVNVHNHSELFITYSAF